MSAGIAHEINNVLGVIIGNVHLVTKRIGSDHEAAGFVEEIRNAADEARELMQELGSLGSDRVAKLRPMDLNAIVGDIRKSITAKLPSGVSITTKFDDKLPMVMMDVTAAVPMIQQLVEFFSESTEEEREIVIETSLEKNRFSILRIGDFAGSPSQEELQEAFEPFHKFRGRSSPGLLLVRAMNTMHRCGGFICADNNEKRGLAIVLGFCVQQESGSAVGKKEGATTDQVRAILSLEDDKVRRLVREALGALGWDVSRLQTHSNTAESLLGTPTQPLVFIVDDSFTAERLSKTQKKNPNALFLFIGNSQVAGVKTVNTPFTRHDIQQAATALVCV